MNNHTVSLKMKLNPQKKRARKSAPNNRRKSKGLPVWRFFKSVGSGFMKLFLFFSVLAAVSLTFVVLYNYLLASPYMKLEHVEIRGVDESIRNDLLQMGGLTCEQALLNLKLEVLKNEMEKHPWVRTATVERRFPDTLIVEVEKEEPALLVLMNKFYYMNRQGELFKTISPNDEIDFPILTGLSPEDPDRKNKLIQTAKVLSVIKKEKDQWSIRNLSEIHLDKNGEISLYFNHMPAAIRIPGQNVVSKMDALKQVAKHLSESGKIHLVTQIDLNHGDSAIVSFKKDQVSG